MKIKVIVLLLAMMTLLWPVSAVQALEPLPPVVEADGHLGTVYTFYDARHIQQAYEAGSRWDRFDIRWNVVAEQGYWAHDEIVGRYVGLGKPLHLLAILGATPSAYANCSASLALASGPATETDRYVGTDRAVRPAATWWNACPPLNLNLPWDDPRNYWGQFVYQTVLRYRDHVDAWEIWNDPDVPFFWQGTASQYAQLLKVAYLAIKAADPDATVVFGGLSYWYKPTFHREVFEALAADPQSARYNAYFDVLALHLYSNSDQAYSITRQVYNAMVASVGPHPVWLTEAGVPISDDGGVATPYAATMEEAASYIIEAYAGARAAGVDKFFVFRMHDAGGIEQFGLTRDDYSIRPAYLAYQVAARYLRDENQITGPWGSTVRRITFWGTPNGKVDVLWNRTRHPINYAFPAVLPTAMLVDRYGNVQTLTAEGGSFHFTLEPVTNFRIGGPPVLLIQSDTLAPQTTGLEAVPTGGGILLRWNVADDAAGYWYEEIEQAASPAGPWTQVAGWRETRGRLEITLPQPSGAGPWYFRARARDRVGNYEPWEEAAMITIP